MYSKLFSIHIVLIKISLKKSKTQTKFELKSINGETFLAVKKAPTKVYLIFGY